MIWLTFLTWVRKVPLWVWAALAIAGAVMFYGHLRYNAGQASVQGKFDAYKQEVKKAVTKQIAQSAAKEAQDRAVFAQIAAQHIKDIENAKAKADRIAADLRAGNIKLRKHWRGCSTAKTPADTARVDEETRLRETDAAENVRDAAEADSWITALQRGWQQCQKQQE